MAQDEMAAEEQEADDTEVQMQRQIVHVAADFGVEQP